MTFCSDVKLAGLPVTVNLMGVPIKAEAYPEEKNAQGEVLLIDS